MLLGLSTPSQRRVLRPEAGSGSVAGTERETQDCDSHNRRGNGWGVRVRAAVNPEQVATLRAVGVSWRVSHGNWASVSAPPVGRSKASSLSAAASRLSSSVPSSYVHPPHAGSTAYSGNPSSGREADYQPRESTDGRKRRRPQLSSPAKPWWKSYVLPLGQKSNHL
jgi:hypothetical protein